MKEFKINIDNNPITILYDETSNKVKIVEELLTIEHINYFEEKWIWLNVFDPFRKNCEDTTKYTLDNIASFILNNNCGEEVMYTNNWIKIKKELSLEGFYLDNVCIENNTIKEYQDISLNNAIINGYIQSYEDYKENNKRKIKRKKKSENYKYRRIFNKKDFYTTDLCKLKNKDVVGIKVPTGITPEEKEAYFNKPFKNAVNQCVYEPKKIKHKGWQGYINPANPYESQWCYVWSDDTFDFCGTKYKIDTDKEETKKYKDLSKTNLRGKNTFISYDKIFAIKQNNKIYFFDLKMNEISQKFVTKVE